MYFLSQPVKAVRSSWNVTTNGFLVGSTNLRDFLISGIKLENNENISDMVAELKEMDKADLIPDNQVMDVFHLYQANIAFGSANDQFWYFTTSALEGMGKDIETEADHVLNITLIVTAGVLALLLILIILVLSFSFRILRRANINLEEQVTERTSSIQNLLDFSGEGVPCIRSRFYGELGDLQRV